MSMLVHLGAFIEMRKLKRSSTVGLSAQVPMGLVGAVVMIPDCEPAYRLRACAYWYSEQFVEAIDAFTWLIENEASPGDLCSRGQAWEELGEFDKALEEGLKAGKIALVIVHAANNSFEKWGEYNRMIGMGWRNKQFGKRLIVDASGKEAGVSAIARVQVPADAAGKSAVLEVNYTRLPGRAVLQTELKSPQLRGDPGAAPVRWQVVLPASWVPLSQDALGAEYGWGRRGWLLALRPTVSTADFERWFAGSDALRPDEMKPYADPTVAVRVRVVSANPS